MYYLYYIIVIKLPPKRYMNYAGYITYFGMTYEMCLKSYILLTIVSILLFTVPFISNDSVYKIITFIINTINDFNNIMYLV